MGICKSKCAMEAKCLVTKLIKDLEIIDNQIDSLDIVKKAQLIFRTQHTRNISITKDTTEEDDNAKAKQDTNALASILNKRKQYPADS